MTLLMPHATRGARPLPRLDAEEMLDEVLRRTENSFLTAGSDLAASVDALRGLSGVFDRLRVTFGAETGARMMGMVAETRDHVTAITDGFGRFLAASDGVRLAVRGMRIEVADLDRVVRTIGTVSINARILGNALIPPRPQVGAFIGRLGEMAGEADAILREMHGAMGGIGAGMAEMDRMTQDLREELEQRVLPALARFDRMARGVLERQGAMAATNAALAERMQGIDAEVGRLVIGLQSGDATRQRLERVRAILSDAGTSRHGAVMLDLAAALSQAAVEAAKAEIAVTVRAASRVRGSANVAVAEARGFYEAKRGTVDEAALAEGFGGAVERVRDKLAEMRVGMAQLRERLGLVLRHKLALRQIGHQVRLSGLNAVLICAKLGEEGRALRELATWLRLLTDESDAIVLRLQEALERTAALADDLGGVGVARFEESLEAFFGTAAALAEAMAAIGRDRREAAATFDVAGAELTRRLGHAVEALGRFELLLREMVLVDAAVAQRRTGLDRAPLDAAGLDEMAALRRLYTMQAERDLHDVVVGIVPEGAAPAPATAPKAAAAEGDGLDDIFF